MCCPQVEFLENWVGRLECVVIFFSKFPKVQNLGAFSTIVIKKKKNWTKLDAIQTIFFLILD